MKKILSVVLVVFILAALFAGCGSKKETPADSSSSPAAGQSAAPAEEGSFSIGFLDQASEAPAVSRMREIVRDVVEAAGGTLICDTTGADSNDGAINAVEKLISAGVSGILFTPIDDTAMPTIMQMCEDAGVYLGLTFRDINDQEVADMVRACEYYAGRCCEDSYTAGYTVMSKVFEKRDNIKQVAIINMPVGNFDGDSREAGIRKVCEENGAEIVAEVRGIAQVSDATEAVQSFVAAYPDLDCIFLVASMVPSATNAVPETMKAMNLDPNEICFAACDTGDNLAALFEEDYTVAVCGGHLEIDRCATAAMVCNAVQGNPLGSPAAIDVPFMYFSSKEEVELYSTFVEGDIPIFTEDEIKSMLLISCNPELTADDVIGTIEDYSVQTLAARHEGMAD